MVSPNTTNKDPDDGKKVDTSRISELSLSNVKVKKSYVPEGFETVKDFLDDMRAEYQADVQADERNRKEGEIDKQFAANNSWDEQALLERKRKGLPCLTFNSIPQFTAQVVGDWRENKRGVKVLPTSDSNIDIADIRGDLIRSIEKHSRADRIYDSAFESAITCGDGAFRVTVEYAKNDAFDQDIYIRPVDNCFSVVWDRNSVDPTGRDAKRVFVDDRFNKKDFKRYWPDKEPTELSEKVTSDLLRDGWLSEDTVRVSSYWRLIEKDKLLLLFEDGSTRFADEEDDPIELMERHGNVLKSRVAPVTYAQMHLVTGYDILAGPYEYQLNRLPIIRMTGRVVTTGDTRVRYGIVRNMRDAVRFNNFWQSVAAEQLGYAPKAQWIATENAVAGYEDDIRKAHLTRDPLMIVSEEAVIGQNIQRLDPPVPQQALFQAAQVNSQNMKDVTGIHDASLGIQSNETSGKAIHARQREGDMAALTYYDNGNAAVLEAGDVINQLISQIYDGTRTIRVIGEDDELRFLRVNDPSNPESPDLTVGKYDVTMTSGAAYSTKRVEAAQAMMDAVQVWPQFMEIAGDLVAKAQDWPGAQEISERLKKALPQEVLPEDEREGPPPELVQAQQLIEQLSSELETLRKDKQNDALKALAQVLRALSDHQVDDQPTQHAGIQVVMQKVAEIMSELEAQ